MKHYSFVIIAAFVLLFACKDKKTNSPSVQIVKDSTGKEVAVLSNNIAFVDIDSIESNYIFYKNKKAEFEQKQKSIDAELMRMASALEAEAMDFQKKFQSGQLTRESGEAIQKSLIGKQNQFEQKRQKMGNDFLKQQEEFDKQIQNNLRGFLKEYAKEKGYDFILSYNKYGEILYANSQKDITEEVVEALNAGKKDNKEEIKTEKEVEKK